MVSPFPWRSMGGRWSDFLEGEICSRGGSRGLGGQAKGWAMRVLRFLIGQGGHAGLQRARWDVWPVGPGSPLSLHSYAVVIRKQPQTGRKQTGVAVSQSSLVSRIRPRPVVCCPLLGNDLGIF